MRNIVDLAHQGVPRRELRLTRLALLFAAFLLLLGMFAPSLFADARLFLAQYGDRYYAFYLDSGDVFFGQVRGVGFGKIVLRNAHTFQSISVGETSTNNLAALRDNPLTKPDNWAVISREHILFYERIGEDASVLSALTAR